MLSDGWLERRLLALFMVKPTKQDERAALYNLLINNIFLFLALVEQRYMLCCLDGL